MRRWEGEQSAKRMGHRAEGRRGKVRRCEKARLGMGRFFYFGFWIVEGGKEGSWEDGKMRRWGKKQDCGCREGLFSILDLGLNKAEHIGHGA